MYVMGHVVHHVNKKDGIRRIINWYRYNAAGDPVEPWRKIRELLQTRYCNHWNVDIAKSANINETATTHLLRNETQKKLTNDWC